jgi:hypothetical protein
MGILESSLKDIVESSRFNDAAAAILQLARQVVGARTFLITCADDQHLLVLKALSEGGIAIAEGASLPLTEGY